jgi:hypothetical protein
MDKLQHIDESFATFVYNRWNIWNIQLKHYCNMCNIPIYFSKYPDATIATHKRRQMEHLRHASETLATCMYKKLMKHWGYTCNVRVQPLQYMQYPNLLLQYPHETIKTYIWDTWNICRNTWNTTSLRSHDLPGGQLRWRRLAGWCALARPPCPPSAERERRRC